MFYLIHNIYTPLSTLVERLSPGLVMLALFVVSFPASSTTLNIPDNTARETLREKERQQQLRQREEVKKDIRLQKKDTGRLLSTIPEKESPCFVIKKISLAGKSSQQFQFSLSTVSNIAGRCLGVKGINAVLARVQNAIIAQGFVTTRVLVAPQDLKSGVLQLTLIPGIAKNIKTEPKISERLLATALPIEEGEILNLRDLEQGLENFERVPTVDADVEIQAAQSDDAKAGESDLLIRYKQGFPLRATFSLDDGGAKSTGRNQAGLTLSYDNPLSINDLLYVSINKDIEGNGSRSGTSGGTVHYSFPWKKWLLSATGSVFDFRQTIASAGQSIRYRGESKTAEIRLSRLLYRGTQRKTSGYVSAYLRSSRNFVNGVEVTLQRRRTAGYEVGVTHREYIGKNTLDATLAYRHGTGAFNSLQAPEDAFGEGSSRPRILKTNLRLSVPFQMLSQNLHYEINVRTQHNGTPLVPQDRFFIGGRNTVRGFDGESVFSADRGWLVRNDISLAPGASGHDLYLGVDYGEVSGQASKLLLGKHLAGMVIGLRGKYKKLNYDVFVGRPVSKPDGFRTARNVAGFNMIYTF